MNEDEYTPQQQMLAREAAKRLTDFAERMTGFMEPHSVTTAFLGTGIEFALRHMPPAAVAAWMQGIADELTEKGDGYDCAGKA